MNALLSLLPGKALLIGAGLALVLIGGAYVVHVIRDDARQGAITEIHKSNMNAERKADEGSSDVARCYDRGGSWVRSLGLCDGDR